MNVGILEPHYDDCWLNMGGLMLAHPEHHYFCVTISKDDNWGNNVNNTKKIGEYLPHFESVDLRLDSLDVNRQRVQKHAAALGVAGYEELFYTINDVKRHNILATLERLFLMADVVFGPVGIVHPMHEVVGTWELYRKPMIRYREFPYAFYSERPCMQTKRYPYVFSVDISGHVSEKVRIFREVYPNEVFIEKLPVSSQSLSEIKDEEFHANKGGAVVWKELL